MLAYFLGQLSRKVRLCVLVGRLLLTVGLLFQLLWLVCRTLEYWRMYDGFLFPASSLFEAINFVLFLIVLIYLCMDVQRNLASFGGWVMLPVLAGFAYILGFLGSESGPRELPPALKSYWLPVHIGVLIVAYAALTIAAVVLLYCLLSASTGVRVGAIDARFSRERLYHLSYQLTAFAYPLLTAGIFLGAVWANEAWGRYWGWDPKETWALITWLLYTIYLHARFSSRWAGHRAALLNLSAYVALVITFVGVNLVTGLAGVESLHSYALASGALIALLLMLALMVLPAVIAHLPAKSASRANAGTRASEGGSDKSAPTKRSRPSAGQREAGLLELLVQLLSSVPVLVVALTVFALLSIPGTLIPQESLGATEAGYIARFGTGGFQALKSLGLTDIYNTVYFNLVFLWLAVSAIVCSVTRMSGFLRRRGASEDGRTEAAFARTGDFREYPNPANIGSEELCRRLGKLRFRLRTSTHDDGSHSVCATRGAIRRWSAFVLHFTIILILLGGVIGRIHGFEGNVRLREGEKRNLTVDVSAGKWPLARMLTGGLPPAEFNLELDDFGITYYRVGATRSSQQTSSEVSPGLSEFHGYAVKDYISDLSVSTDGKEKHKRVVVNHPLGIAGTRFYQASYAQTGYVVVRFDGKESTHPVMPGHAYVVSPAGGLVEFGAEAEAGGELLYHPPPQGGAFPVKYGSLYEGGRRTSTLGPLGLFELVDLKTEASRSIVLKPDKWQKLNVPGHDVAVRMSPKVEEVSIFSYRNDPGVPFVFAGWILLIIGVLVTLYVPFVELRVSMSEEKVIVSARARGMLTEEAGYALIEKTLAKG